MKAPPVFKPFYELLFLMDRRNKSSGCVKRSVGHVRLLRTLEERWLQEKPSVLKPPPCVQDCFGAGQRRGLDRRGPVSLLQAQKIRLQRLSPERPAEAEGQRPAERSDSGDAASRQRGGDRLVGGDGGEAEADRCRRGHRRRLERNFDRFLSEQNKI